MFERVVENWLTRVNERSLEIPFAQMLAGERYQVVHISRHGPAEEGKDILAIDPDGTPCAFQLKGNPGGKFTQTLWEKEREQVTRLVEIPIIHPSIDLSLPRRVFLVTNGELDEEVRTEIAHRNIDWERRGYPKLETIVKGQLFARFQHLHTNLWPIRLEAEKALLEFYLAEGNGCLPKAQLSQFLCDLLPLDEEKPNKSQCARSLTSAALFTSYALTSYEQRQNHVAVFEGWILYCAHLIALVEKFQLPESYWQSSLDIALVAIEHALLSLVEELQIRNHLVEGNGLFDQPFYRGRITWLMGLISAFAIWQWGRDSNKNIGEWYNEFIASHQKDLHLWGEGAIPQFLATAWFLQNTSGTIESEKLLLSLTDIVCELNTAQNMNGLPDPYHSLGEVVAENLPLKSQPNREFYRGRSYVLHSLVSLVVRRGWRQNLKWLWPQISRITFEEFVPDQPWKFCLWHCEDGILKTTTPPMRQSWAALKAESQDYSVKDIPTVLERNPELLLLFVITYPHRLTPDVVKHLDSSFRNLRIKSRY